jgi:hypothetical protein
MHCWQLRSAATGTTTVVTAGTAKPGAGVRLLVPFGAFRASDRLTLVAPDGAISDTTVLLTDKEGDGKVWFRTDGDWQFGNSTVSLSVSDGKTGASTSGC